MVRDALEGTRAHPTYTKQYPMTFFPHLAKWKTRNLFSTRHGLRRCKAVTRLHPAFANHKALCPTKQVLIYDYNRFDLITPYMLIRCEKYDHRKTEDKNNDFKLCIRIRSKLPYDSNSFSWLIKWVDETIAALTSKWWWLKFLSIIRTMLKGCFWFRQGLGFEEGRNPKLFEVHVCGYWMVITTKNDTTINANFLFYIGV